MTVTMLMISLMIISFVDNVFVDDGDAVFDDSGVLKEVVGLEAEVDERTLCTHTNFHKSECWWRSC